MVELLSDIPVSGNYQAAVEDWHRRHDQEEKEKQETERVLTEQKEKVEDKEEVSSELHDLTK